MTRYDQLARRTTMASRNQARGSAHGRARDARSRRSFDGVVASYIRELAAAGATTPRAASGRELQHR
jgi:hypothetical protein